MEVYLLPLYICTHTYIYMHRVDLVSNSADDSVQLIHTYRYIGIHGVMDTVVGNGHSNASSNLGQNCLHFTLC